MLLNNNKFILILLILAPYIYLFPHTFHLIEMGNDFELLYYSYKKYIFEFVKVGHFPLWSPSESLGYSLIFNPFAQYFYDRLRGGSDVDGGTPFEIIKVYRYITARFLSLHISPGVCWWRQ